MTPLQLQCEPPRVNLAYLPAEAKRPFFVRLLREVCYSCPECSCLFAVNVLNVYSRNSKRRLLIRYTVDLQSCIRGDISSAYRPDLLVSLTSIAFRMPRRIANTGCHGHRMQRRKLSGSQVMNSPSLSREHWLNILRLGMSAVWRCSIRSRSLLKSSLLRPSERLPGPHTGSSIAVSE